MPNYLRKHGTNRIYLRTKLLAARPDMVAISEEEAHACLATMQESQRTEAAARAEAEQAEISKPSELTKDAPTGLPAERPLEQLTDEELRAKADAMKLYIHHACKRDTIIAKLREAAEEPDAPAEAATGSELRSPTTGE